MSAASIARATEGSIVLEADFTSSEIAVEDLLAAAHAAGADLIWVHGGDLAGCGFRSVPGYVRLTAAWITTSVVATGSGIVRSGSAKSLATRPGLMTEAFLDQWGHKLVDPSTETADPDHLVLTLEESNRIVGICRLWPGDRLIDGPGIIPDFRTPERKAWLLLAACRALGDGPVDLDTWGEDQATIAGYLGLGFRVVTREPGWELRLA